LLEQLKADERSKINKENQDPESANEIKSDIDDDMHIQSSKNINESPPKSSKQLERYREDDDDDDIIKAEVKKAAPKHEVNNEPKLAKVGM